MPVQLPTAADETSPKDYHSIKRAEKQKIASCNCKLYFKTSSEKHSWIRYGDKAWCTWRCLVWQCPSCKWNCMLWPWCSILDKAKPWPFSQVSHWGGIEGCSRWSTHCVGRNNNMWGTAYCSWLPVQYKNNFVYWTYQRCGELNQLRPIWDEVHGLIWECYDSVWPSSVRKKWLTKNAYFRLSTTLLGIDMTDSFLLENYHKIINYNSYGSDDKKSVFRGLLACCPTSCWKMPSPLDQLLSLLPIYPKKWHVLERLWYHQMYPHQVTLLRSQSSSHS